MPPIDDETIRSEARFGREDKDFSWRKSNGETRPLMIFASASHLTGPDTRSVT